MQIWLQSDYWHGKESGTHTFTSLMYVLETSHFYPEFLGNYKEFIGRRIIQALPWFLCLFFLESGQGKFMIS